MPGYRAHLFGGLAVFTVAWYGVTAAGLVQPHAGTMLEWLCCALLGSLFPDIDTKSKGQKVFYLGILTASLFLLSTGNTQIMALVGCAAMIPLLVRHRGIFHRTWFVIALPTAVALLMSANTCLGRDMLMWDALFFILGAVSHLVLDLGIRRTFSWR